MSTKSYEDSPEERSWVAYFETLTHSQFFHSSSIGRDLAGETHLQFAAMEETVRCVLRYQWSPSAAGRREMSEAREWVNFYGNHDRFSFDSICQVFEIDSGMFRQRLNSISRRFRSSSPFFKR
jgi:hypothetical protein